MILYLPFVQLMFGDGMVCRVCRVRRPLSRYMPLLGICTEGRRPNVHLEHWSWCACGVRLLGPWDCRKSAVPGVEKEVLPAQMYHIHYASAAEQMPVETGDLSPGAVKDRGRMNLVQKVVHAHTSSVGLGHIRDPKASQSVGGTRFHIKGFACFRAI